MDFLLDSSIWILDGSPLPGVSTGMDLGMDDGYPVASKLFVHLPRRLPHSDFGSWLRRLIYHTNHCRFDYLTTVTILTPGSTS